MALSKPVELSDVHEPCDISTVLLLGDEELVVDDLEDADLELCEVLPGHAGGLLEVAVVGVPEPVLVDEPALLIVLGGKDKTAREKPKIY